MADKSNYSIALEVLAGKWGNGIERRDKITAAGYDYKAVQSIVNALVNDGYLKNPQPEPAAPEEPTKPLEVDYDSEKYNGIIVNIIV